MFSETVEVHTDGTCTADQVSQLNKWTADAIDKIESARACDVMSCSELVLTLQPSL